MSDRRFFSERGRSVGDNGLQKSYTHPPVGGTAGYEAIPGRSRLFGRDGFAQTVCFFRAGMGVVFYQRRERWVKESANRGSQPPFDTRQLTRWLVRPIALGREKGVSLRTLELFVGAFSTRLVGLLFVECAVGAAAWFFETFNFLLAAAAYTVIRFHEPTKFTYDQRQESFAVSRLFAASCVLPALVGANFRFGEALNFLSHLVEAGAAVPQLITLRQSQPASNGVQSFVTLMFLHHSLFFVLTSSMHSMLAAIPYFLFFMYRRTTTFVVVKCLLLCLFVVLDCYLNAGMSDSTCITFDDDEGDEVRQELHQGKMWLVAVRGEVSPACSSLQQCFLVLRRAILDNEIVHNWLVACCRESNIIYRNVKREFSGPFSTSESLSEEKGRPCAEAQNIVFEEDQLGVEMDDEEIGIGIPIAPLLRHQVRPPRDFNSVAVC
jgi:ER lumen protein retaining receptor